MSKIRTLRLTPHFEAGFSLVELMVGMMIVGILASMAQAKIMKPVILARQVEAKTGLEGIYLSMNSYYANFQGFPQSGPFGFMGQPYQCNWTEASLLGVGFPVSGARPRYLYSIASCPEFQGSSHFAWNAEAQSIDVYSTQGGKVYDYWGNLVITMPGTYYLDTWRINPTHWYCSIWDAANDVWPISIPSGAQVQAQRVTECPGANYFIGLGNILPIMQFAAGSPPSAYNIIPADIAN